jgi:deoxyribodipyrimidine photo-lyase
MEEALVTVLRLHDRPWPARPVYGTIRSTARSGMERKSDVAAYLEEIKHLERTGEEPKE